MSEKAVLIRVTYKPGKMQEFGWLPPVFHAETVGSPGYGAFLGQGTTNLRAVDDLLGRIKAETGKPLTNYIIDNA